MRDNQDQSYPILQPAALRVLEARYLRRDHKGSLRESPDQMFHRVSEAVAAAERKWHGDAGVQHWTKKFFHLMRGLYFLPNSPTLMNAGTNRGQLSACFVLPVEDNLDAIFSALHQAALIQQSGGGTGFNFSKLRPEGDLVQESGGVASGPVSFMKVFDAATEHIRQGGKRRGANMGILNVDHPDIFSFIQSKQEKGALRNFNISVGITDAFMQALESGADWHLRNPNGGAVSQTVPAHKLWERIVQAAWSTGDPGLIFLSAINERNPTPRLGEIQSTNPCGEVPLLPYEPCNLGSINLSRFIHKSGGSYRFHWDALGVAVNDAVRFLDDVIDVNHYIISPIREMALGNRKIGLGVMGWADSLIRMGIPYASEEALALGAELMRFVAERAHQASSELAAERGVFPNWKNSVYAPALPMRNATCTSIAPTGTISIIAGTSSSIEPLFALAFRRMHVLHEDVLDAVSPGFLEYLSDHRYMDKPWLQEVLSAGDLSGSTDVPEAMRLLFQTSTEINPDWHLRHQLVFQKHTDNAVSKTINLPHSASITEVDHIYRMAWKERAKGITIFRDGSTGSQVLHKGVSEQTDTCRVCVR